MQKAVLLSCCEESCCLECVRKKATKKRDQKSFEKQPWDKCPLCHKAGFSANSLVPNTSLRNIIQWFYKQRCYRTIVHRMQFDQKGCPKRLPEEGEESDKSSTSEEEFDFEAESEKIIQ
mmetsp:Transcript_16947/g.26091  ORF Transcript_16947/g.26091 Transcript_16947/m.26091 type:complete len:119 (+) Transcript_16947:499-855(+)